MIKGERKAVDMIMMAFGVIMLGSIWGLLECILGGFKPERAGIPISMGAVMAGLFGIGFMVLARKMFDMVGVSFAVALFAGILRFVAPVGSCVLCAAIAIMVEGLIFEIIVNRKVILGSIRGSERDIRTLAFAGVASGFLIFSIGYVVTQFMTPLVTEGTLIAFSDIIGILPLIAGRAFYAALLGGISMPAVVVVDLVHLDVNKFRKGAYYTASGLVSVACWILVLLVFF
jgi:hypothetical protein